MPCKKPTAGTLSPVQRLSCFVITLYRLFISPLLPAACRFFPSCSEYAEEAIRLHGVGKGSWFTLKRLCRCHPWGGSGIDPVPPVSKKSKDIT